VGDADLESTKDSVQTRPVDEERLQLKAYIRLYSSPADEFIGFPQQEVRPSRYVQRFPAARGPTQQIRSEVSHSKRSNSGSQNGIFRFFVPFSSRA